VAILEPYYGGSHAIFVDTIRRHSRHRCTLATMPARKWKWRMRGAAIWFAHQDNAWQSLGGGAAPDVILCNDMLSVSDLRGLLEPRLWNAPIVCYLHENQLTYPIPDEQDRDFQYGMTNITSCLAADAVWFNSRFHLEDFLAAVGGLLRKMPDCVPDDVVEQIRRKAAVFPPPVAAGKVDREEKHAGEPLTILWCHRWEYDKNPEPFFDALLRLDAAGLPFGLVLLGEQFRTAPPVFASAWDRLRSHVRHAGFLENPDEYTALLSRCDLVVSTAIQENFGVGVAEAIQAGCQPLLPDRLAYPELIPAELHEKCLYPADNALFPRLRDLMAGRGLMPANERRRLQESVEQRFGVDVAVKAMDNELVQLAERAD
jgi:glycosyltransferase involved in cell wall biosynthesis